MAKPQKRAPHEDPAAPLSDPELDALERNAGVQTRRLAAEVRRLRALILHAYPYVPENEETRDLVAKLKAEMNRR